MATATILTEQVEVPPAEPVYETVTTGYRIDLTVREAIVLRAILSNIGGMREGHRGDADTIADALDSLDLDGGAVEAVLDTVIGNSMTAPVGAQRGYGHQNRGAIYFGPSKVIND